MLTKCLNCGLQDSQLILDFGSIPIASLLNSVDIFPLEYRKCIKCLVTCVTTSPPSDLLYGENYNFFSSASSSYISYAGEIIKTLEANTFLSKCNVLEIGCNDGTLLRQLSPKAKYIVGIDPFLIATGPLVGQIPNGNIINNYFTSETVEKHNLQESFDVVIVNNVITHVEDVFDFLKALSSVTKKNGIIYFEMCDYQKVVECKRFDYFYHGVTNLILPQQIQSLLSDFECIADYGFNGFDPFSYKFVLKKTNSLQKNYPIKEQSLQTMQPDFLSWCEKIDTFFNDISSSKKIVGYAANSKAGSVLALSPIAAKKIDVILDINLMKTNKNIAGSNIKVKHIDDCKLDDIDCIVLFASHIFDEVRRDLYKRGYTDKILILDI